MKTNLKTLFFALLAGMLAPLTAGAEIVDGACYHIVNAWSGKTMTNKEFEDNNANITLTTEDEKKWGQVWEARRYANDVFYLVNPYCEKAIDQNPYGGGQLLQWQYSMGASGSNQRFYIAQADVDADTYVIYNNEKPQNGSYDARSRCIALQSSVLLMSADTESATSQWIFKKIDTEKVEPPTSASSDNVWEDQAIFGINKEKAHASFIPYPSTEALKADAETFAHPWITPAKNTSYLSLCGTWKFLFASNTDERPQEEFYADDVDANAWDDIHVPGCWEMFGYDKMMYLNVEYAFADNPPFIRNKVNGVGDNPVGSYRRDFTLPSGWEEQRVFLHFDGLYSGAFVWVNGKEVGYTQGGNNDAEFDITPYVRTGSNNISVQVIRWTDGSYLEGQDMWHMSGLHRDVYLYATPRTFLRDHYVSTALTAQAGYKRGTMTFEMELDNRDGKAATKQIDITLLSPAGEELNSWSKTFSLAEGETSKTMKFTTPTLTNLQTWSAEHPTLYTLLFSQKSEEGKEEMAFQTKFGFRDVTVKNSLVYINGQRVYFRGVNTQDTHPVLGRSIDIETMLTDILMMKQANVNTVRTSHYPRQPKMYAMFDYYGLYVMDEADVECHKNWNDGGGISNDASWQPQYIDRTERMVFGHRNHPSIIFWSLGNESGTGQNLKATYDRCKDLDSRPVHYEGATRGWANYTDLHSHMYPSLDEVRSSSKGNSRSIPYFMCEYAHAMGNGVGNLREYWDIIEGSNMGIGGCIWDWVDQTVYDPAVIPHAMLVPGVGHDPEKLDPALSENGFPRYVSGYDMPGNHQGNFLNNGIITPDRAWTPKLAEVKKIYQPASLVLAEDGERIVITNKLNFTNLNELCTLHYEGLKAGKVISEGDMELPALAPGAADVVYLPADCVTDGDGYVNLELRLKEASLYAEAGYPIATEQIKLAAAPDPAPTPKPETSALTVKRNGTDKTYTISGERVRLTIGDDGFIKEYVSNGVNMLAAESPIDQPIYSNIRWIENESPYGGHSFGNSSAAITSTTLNKPTLSEGDTQANFRTTVSDDQCKYSIIYTLLNTGELKMEVTYTPVANGLRRIGLDMKFPAGFEHVAYYGRGPLENYIDRCDAAYMGYYETTIDNLYQPYIHPQSNGNRMDARLIELRNPDTNQCIRIKSEGGTNFSLSHFDQSKFLKAVVHNWELKRQDEVFATLDYMQRGLGNGSCGPGTLSEYYCPSSGSYKQDLSFIGISQFDTSVRHTLTDADPSASNAAIYNLGGVRLPSLEGQPHGIYIVKDGKGSQRILRK